MVGVSTHNPAVVDTVESENWDVDYYQTCLYRVSRTAEEARKEYGEAPVGEIYMEKDPERMCKMIRQTKKTCFAFKILAAGRNIKSKAAVEGASAMPLRSTSAASRCRPSEPRETARI